MARRKIRLRVTSCEFHTGEQMFWREDGHGRERRTGEYYQIVLSDAGEGIGTPGILKIFGLTLWLEEPMHVNDTIEIEI